MIERYTRPEIGRIWSEESKYGAWLRVEIAVCEAYARQGRIPAAAMDKIRATRVDIGRILAIQQRVKHEDNSGGWEIQGENLRAYAEKR